MHKNENPPQKRPDVNESEQQPVQVGASLQHWNDLLEAAKDYPEELSAVEVRLHARLKRESRWRSTVRGSLSAVAAAIFFVILVNTSTAFAGAVADLPVLGTLAEFVKFDRSLTNAIQNDYVQEVGLIAWDGDQQLSLPYIISDEKNLVLFFQLPKNIELKDGEFAQVILQKMTNAETGEEIGEGWCSYQSGEMDEDSDGYMQVSIHTSDVSFPKSVNLSVTLERSGTSGPVYYEEVEPGEEVESSDPIEAGTFDFHLQLKELTKPKVYEFHENYAVLDQEVTLEQIKVYPTGTEVKLNFPEANTAWIKGMNLAIEQNGEVISEGIKNGISASGDQSSTSFFIESNYFAKAKPQELLIRGLRLLDKDKTTVTVDLYQKTITPKIPGTKITNVTFGKTGKAKLELAAKVTDDVGFDLFGSDYSDTAGNHYFLSGYAGGVEDLILTNQINVVVPPDGKLIFQRSTTPMQYLEEPVRIKLPE